MIVPQQISFWVDGANLNVFSSGQFAGQIPLLPVPPDPGDLPFAPANDLCFVPQSDLMFA